MSAIFGLVHTQCQPVNPALLDRMAAAMIHRGPDGHRTCCAGSVGLGHLMLHTTPESLSEELPLTSREGDVMLTAAARLDNRDDLAKQLGLAPDPAQADSAILLSAYRRWGEDCPRHLIGDFALAVWNRRDHTLFCARDPLGVKPLYYAWDRPTFAFATEIKGLLALPHVSRQLDERSIADFLLLSADDRELTFFEAIKRLPPGHALRVSARGLRIWRYWALDDAPALHLASDEDYADQFRALFTEAVRVRVRSALPVGTLLSGGLDSSSVTCLARKLHDGSLSTFSAIYPTAPESDEQEFIDAVVAQGGLTSHTIRADLLPTLPEPEKLFFYLEEPYLPVNLFVLWALSRLAQQNGVRVMLDGFDGDTALSHGFAILTDLARQQRWAEYQAEVSGLLDHWWQAPPKAALGLHRQYGFPALTAHVRALRWHRLPSALATFSQISGVSRQVLVKDYLVRPFVPAPVLRFWQRAHGYEATCPPLLNPDFAHRLSRHLTQRAHETPPPTGERESHIRLLTAGHITRGLEMFDRLEAAFGMEFRHPFYDQRIIEFCVGLPNNQKLSRGLSRLVLRRAMMGILPPEVQQRTDKARLGYPFRRRFAVHEREEMWRAAFAAPDLLDQYIDRVTLQDRHKELDFNIPGNRVMHVWLVLQLGQWLNQPPSFLVADSLLWDYF
jgi:asparagine synthase (glutamine-hydrolysing)